jgi:hypothetical protein
VMAYADGEASAYAMSALATSVTHENRLSLTIAASLVYRARD